jgi:hypothetical protein
MVEVHQHQRVVAGLDGLDDGRGRFHGFGGVTLAFEQETAGFQNPRLVVGYENACGRRD